MKRGLATTEFWVHAATLVATWTATALALSGNLQDVLPKKYDPWLVLATTILSALQAAAYSVSRSSVKTADLDLQAELARKDTASLALEARKLGA